MKLLLATLVTAFALVLSVKADDVTAKITGVHLCCDKCVQGVDKAVGTVSGAKAASDKADGTVTITAPDKETAQKAANALVAAGYFGVSSDVTLDPSTGAKDKKVKTTTITGLHLCCGKCVKAVDTTCKSVAGVTAQDAAKGASSFTVTGDFNQKELMDALQKAGLTGKVSE